MTGNRKPEHSIYNLTQHAATPDQIADGVVEPADKSHIQELLTFDTIPTLITIQKHATLLATCAHQAGATHALIGGAPYLMRPLEEALLLFDIVPLYSFSERRSVEEQQPDGSISKRTIFQHIGFIETK